MALEGSSLSQSLDFLQILPGTFDQIPSEVRKCTFESFNGLCRSPTVWTLLSSRPLILAKNRWDDNRFSRRRRNRTGGQSLHRLSLQSLFQQLSFRLWTSGHSGGSPNNGRRRQHPRGSRIECPGSRTSGHKRSVNTLSGSHWDRHSRKSITQGTRRHCIRRRMLNKILWTGTD